MLNILIDLGLLGAAGYGFHNYRNYWTHRQLAPTAATVFDGQLFQVGETDIARRHSHQQSTKTIVCFPGFLEDQRYFLELYKNSAVELIIINNADYHSAFSLKNAVTPDWGQNNPYKVSTIEHDAYILCEVIENLVSTEDILIHGHSRGAAVALEAAQQRPELMKNATALLEAPVLPQAKTVGAFDLFMKLGGYYFFPLFFGVVRNLPEKYRTSPTFVYPHTEEKRTILATSPLVPKRYKTAIINMINIAEWQKRNFYDVYSHFKEIRIVIPERDAVLSRRAMLNSALKAKNVNIIRTKGTNHFISVEQPATILAAAGLSVSHQTENCELGLA